MPPIHEIAALAHEAGALTDEEYAEIRLKLHDMLDLESDFGLSAIDPTE